MNYKHFTIEERALLEIYKIHGLKNHECAKRLNNHESTISRELNDVKLTNTLQNKQYLDYKYQQNKCGNKKKIILVKENILIMD